VLSRISGPLRLSLFAAPIVALLVVVGVAPLPFTVAEPGLTANVLGSFHGTPVIAIKGSPVRKPEGELRMTTIEATGPSADVRLGDVVKSWFRTDEAVLPRDSVYPAGQSEKEIEKGNTADMTQSQNAAVDAALGYLHRDPKSVDVTLRLADVGGPSAGLFFALGIVDKLHEDLTGGLTIAGTGTISDSGKVGAVGGVSLKTQAAARGGATVFVVPKAECRDARAELPQGMRLIPVTTLSGAVNALRALKSTGAVPHC